MDGEPEGHTQFTSPGDIEPIPTAERPHWYPPLRLCFAAELDLKVIAFCNAGRIGDHWLIDWPGFFDLIGFIWSKRLRLQSEALWHVLGAHGIPEIPGVKYLISMRKAGAYSCMLLANVT